MIGIWHMPVALLAFATMACGTAAAAPKSGGTLRVQLIDNPPSASIHEEGTASVVIPFMPIHANLVIYDPHEPRNSLESIRPELATAWRWNAEKTELTFTMREGAKWHDGKPVTAEDVKCTFEQVAGLEGKSLRKSPRDAWYGNVARIGTGGNEVTFHLKRPQPALLALLASGWSPVYPCHVPAAQQRSKPVGAGPFKFVEFRANESIKFVRNPDYWKPGFPLLDGIEWKIMSSRSTRMLSFVSGEFDMTHPTDVSVLLLKDIKDAPAAYLNLSPLIIDTHTETLDTPEKKKNIKMDLFMYSKYTPCGADAIRLYYVGTEVDEDESDMRNLSCYAQLVEEFTEYFTRFGGTIEH